MSYVAGSWTNSPFVYVRPRSSGFWTRLSNPWTLPWAWSSQVKFSSTWLDIVVWHWNTGAALSGYAFSGAWFWTKYTGADEVSNSGCIDIHPNDNAVVNWRGATPFIDARPFTSWSWFWTKFSNPAILPPSTVNWVKFSNNGNYLLVSHNNTPFISAYNRSGSWFWTKITNPVTLPTTTCRWWAWSPNDDYVWVWRLNSPYVHVYEWSWSWFGSIVTNPWTAVTSGVVTARKIRRSPDWWQIIIWHWWTIRAAAYTRSSGFGSKLTDPWVAITAECRDISFDTNWTNVFLACATNVMQAYPRSSTWFWTKYTNSSAVWTSQRWVDFWEGSQVNSNFLAFF